MRGGGCIKSFRHTCPLYFASASCRYIYIYIYLFGYTFFKAAKSTRRQRISLCPEMRFLLVTTQVFLLPNCGDDAGIMRWLRAIMDILRGRQRNFLLNPFIGPHRTPLCPASLTDPSILRSFGFFLTAACVKFHNPTSGTSAEILFLALSFLPLANPLAKKQQRLPRNWLAKKWQRDSDYQVALRIPLN